MKKLLFILFSVLLLASCKTKEKLVEVPVIKKEIQYKDRIQYDSIYTSDTVYTIYKGDTVYHTNIKYRYKYVYLRDTINNSKTDTIAKVVRVTETKVENKLNVVQKTLIYIGILSIVIFGVGIYLKFKK